MKVTTKALVLHTHKYGDTSLIVKLYTEESGLKSYLLRGVLASKKGKTRAAYFQPLTQLEIVATHKNTGSLSSISDVKVDFPYATLHSNFQKNSLVFFLAEVLYAVLREEEENLLLFQYVTIMLQWLDAHNEIANFHIFFMLNLSKFLGFYPDEVDEDAIFFDLVEGQFLNRNVSTELIEDEQLAIFKALLQTDLDELQNIKMSKANRMALLHKMLTFYQLHLEGFRKPKSLQILTEIMM
ncbi:DNA replication and repair protein RecO [Pustulibacterium marinum]|uniref:DNA repair protein RecO n=1 Tax=Pustulibacterium marinum TaxID=1224947 RepID=A0A1I7HCU0_9FLAO|nr:DNA repair protein RecO [Pustulibacterium marinum]SFU58422.1 DNA replication and repair protein RecO [Pustulibacterium marinum]